MSGPNDAREETIVNAIADIIVWRCPSILPATTINQPGGTAIGDQAFTVANTDKFVNGHYIHWFDNTGETFNLVGTVDHTAKTFTLNFDGYADMDLPVGLQSPHANGALVVGNLVTHKGFRVGPMFANGLPVVMIYPRSSGEKERSVQTTMAYLVVRVAVYLPIHAFEANPIDYEILSGTQQKRSWRYLAQIKNALNMNRHLMTFYNDSRNHAQGLGFGNRGDEFARTAWDTIIGKDIETPQAVAAMDVLVRADPFIR